MGLKKEPVVTARTKRWSDGWKQMVEKQNLQITRNAWQLPWFAPERAVHLYYISAQWIRIRIAAQ
jgi:hypothetical protein